MNDLAFSILVPLVPVVLYLVFVTFPIERQKYQDAQLLRKCLSNRKPERLLMTPEDEAIYYPTTDSDFAHLAKASEVLHE